MQASTRLGAASPGKRRAPSSRRDSDSFHRQAYFRRPGLPGGPADLRSAAQRPDPAPARAFLPGRQAHGSCGIAWPETQVRPGAPAAERPLRYGAGIGTPLQAFITGLHGACPAICVNVPNATAVRRIVSTAMGRRFQLFSPSPEKNGSARRKPSAITGPISNAGVSIEGGSSERTAYSHRKK